MLRLPPVSCIHVLFAMSTQCDSAICVYNALFSSFIQSSVSFGFVLMYSRSFVYIIQFIELRFYFNQFRQITLKYARSFNTWPCSRKPILTERRNNAEHGSQDELDENEMKNNHAYTESTNWISANERQDEWCDATET